LLDTTPSTLEICGDGVDNNGDGLADEGCLPPPPPPCDLANDATVSGIGVTGPSPLYVGDTVTLVAQLTAGDPPVFYLWESKPYMFPDNWYSTFGGSSQTESFSSSQANTFTIRVSATGPCGTESSATTDVKFNPIKIVGIKVEIWRDTDPGPLADYDWVEDTTAYVGEDLRYSPITDPPNRQLDSYEWNETVAPWSGSAAVTRGPAATEQWVVTEDVAGSATVTLTGESGGEPAGSASAFVNINEYTLASADIDPDQVCKGADVHFTADISPASPAASGGNEVTWYRAAPGTDPTDLSLWTSFASGRDFYRTENTAGKWSIIAVLNSGGMVSTAFAGTLTVVGISGLTVTDATQNGVVGADNWAAVKRPGFWVTIDAQLEGGLDDVDAAGIVTWDGGLPVSNSQNKVSRAAPIKEHVGIMCNGALIDYVDVWIVWATIAFRTSGSKSAENAANFNAGTGGDILGPVDPSVSGSSLWGGKIETVVQLEPAGVWEVVTGGWDIRRNADRFRIIDGGPPDMKSDPTGGPNDDMHNSDEDLVPDPDDKIYGLDNPGTWDHNFTTTMQYHANFYEWVEWNSELASTKGPYENNWYVRTKVDKSLSNPTVYNVVSTGYLDLDSPP